MMKGRSECSGVWSPVLNRVSRSRHSSSSRLAISSAMKRVLPVAEKYKTLEKPPDLY